jgi:alkanesulfonate monooxygenase SsuD/methylene tetrahydromethanopterin reductase-like flavin-dependent oxidoreductase (luciferase family)
MRTGVALFAQNYTDWERFDSGDWDTDPVVSDRQIFAEEMIIGDLVEPLGFDSMWTVEHHFTPYTMDTNTLQFLTYFAGRTATIDFGTMVIVLPWHDPIRVAEEAALLDHFLQGRKLTLGFGRGAAKVEFDGLRIDMDSSRERFLEALSVVRKALSSKHFSHEGKYFQIPDLAIRPRPRSDLLADMHMAWGSPTSVAVAAENGLKPLVIPQKQWQAHVDEMREYNRIVIGLGRPPAQPTVLLAVYVDDDPVRAGELGHQYALEYADSARRHYRMDDPAHLANVKGYEYYSDTARKFADAGLGRPDRRKEMLEAAKRVDLKAMSTQELFGVFVDSHVWGTPDSVREQLQERLRGVGAEQFVGVFKFGSMSLAEAESSIRLFGAKVLPGLHEMATPSPIVPD